MSSCPNSPRPHTVARRFRSRSWPTAEVPAEDGGEEASLSIDSSTQVGLEFGDDGSVRLLLLSSGDGRDRRRPIPTFPTSVGSSLFRQCLDFVSGVLISCLLPHVSEERSGEGRDRRSSLLPSPIFPTSIEANISTSNETNNSTSIQIFTTLIPNSIGKTISTSIPIVPAVETNNSTSIPILTTIEANISTSIEGNISTSIRIIPKIETNISTSIECTCSSDSLRPEPKRTTEVAKIIRFIASIFKKNKQAKSSIESRLGTTKIGLARIFSYEELNQATNSFKQELADGGFSRVYLGKLQDNQKVAVKVLYEGIPKRMEQFLNEVTVLSRLRHRNLVALYGCTDPETQKLLLVYEFVPNGTIAEHLYGQLPSLTWDVRMQIAIETAEALSYLHSCEPPIIHRDVKTSNILLDNDFHVKVADLGMCCLVPWDTTYVSTLPQGTVGYRDPEYDEFCKLTLKSDVYSFGVVLLELISGKQAVDVNREVTEIYLFKMAVKKILNKELDQLVDLRLGYGSDSEISRMVSSVAALSCVCLQPKADPRPPMVEVLAILKGIRDEMHYI